MMESWSEYIPKHVFSKQVGRTVTYLRKEGGSITFLSLWRKSAEKRKKRTNERSTRKTTYHQPKRALWFGKGVEWSLATVAGGQASFSYGGGSSTCLSGCLYMRFATPTFFAIWLVVGPFSHGLKGERSSRKSKVIMAWHGIMDITLSDLIEAPKMGDEFEVLDGTDNEPSHFVPCLWL